MRASHERNLTSATDLAVCVSDMSGVMLSSSIGHARRLGRSIDEVVGCNWRDWTFASDRLRIEELSARVNNGPQHTSLLVKRSDGRVSVSRLSMIATVTADGRHAVLGVHSAIYVSERIQSLDLSVPFDVASFVGDLAASLSQMASQTGLTPLAETLESLVATYGRILDRSRPSLH